MKFVRVTLTATVAALCLTAQIPDFTPPTPLFGAISRSDAAEVKRLLAAGANPNEAHFIGAEVKPADGTVVHRKPCTEPI